MLNKLSIYTQCICVFNYIIIIMISKLENNMNDITKSDKSFEDRKIFLNSMSAIELHLNNF